MGSFDIPSAGRGTRNSDVGLDIRMIWAAAYVLLAVAAWVLPEVERGGLLAWVFLSLVPVQLFWHEVLPSASAVIVRIAHDALVIFLVVILAPNLWFPCVIFFVMGVNNIGVNGLPKLSKVAVFASLIGLTIIGYVNRQPAWMATVVGLTVMLGMRMFVVDSIWRRVEDAESQLDAMFDSVSAVLHTADPYTGKVLWVSRNIERVTGWTPEEWMALDAAELLHPDDLEHFWLPLRSMRLGNEHVRYARHRRRDGEWIWLSVNSTIVAGADGRLQMRGHYTDASELVSAQKEITALAETDAVTGLANRHVLLRELEARLQADASFGLLMLDIDRFKEINDTLGHEFGDEVLKELANRLRQSAPGSVVARLGGDEFAVLDDNAAGIGALADRIGAGMLAPMRFGALTVSTEVSIGSIVAPEDGASSEDLLRRVDVAMYLAKRRRQVHIEFRPEMEQASARELQLSAAIGEALETKQFEVFFQPKVNLLTGEVLGAEGLTRWRHPEHGLLRPAAFMRLVGLSNLHGVFTDQVIEQAVAFASRARQESGQPLPVAVNVMVSSLFDEEFPERLRRLLDVHNVSPDCLTLEVTEDDIMEEFASVSPVLAALANLGVRLSIDDFGTGYSSLSRLVDLPVTEIKIDRGFVTGVTTDVREQAVIESILLLAGRLGLDVVAEGVETASDVELLTSLGCEVGQGFLYSSAIPADELLLQLSLATGTRSGAGVLDPGADVIRLYPDESVSSGH